MSRSANGYRASVAPVLTPCSACGSTSPSGANFCPACGQILAENGTVAYTVSPPRLFGVLSPVAAFVAGSVLLLGAIVALVAASVVLGIVLLAAAIASFVHFYGAAERDPSSAVARGAVTASARVRGWTSLTAGSTRAWTRTGRDLLRLRGELRALRDDRERAQAALGGAAYREDDAAVISLASLSTARKYSHQWKPSKCAVPLAREVPRSDRRSGSKN